MNTIMKDAATIAILSSISLLTACSSEEDVEGPTYIRDIQPLIAAKCAHCHTQGGIAPFPLETFEQVSAMKSLIASDVAARIMPPWLAAEGCTEYSGDISLTDEQISLITGWVSAGAPQGDPKDTPVAVKNDRLTLSRVDLELPIPEPYTPKLFPDDYRCFFVDWPASDTTYITGFGVEPGNKAIVHHVIAYLVKPAQISTFQALDDADTEPGWPCFGGPGGEGSGPGTASWLGGWAPGGAGEDFPEGTGLEVAAGSKVVLQLHYNSESSTVAPDQTKILVRTDATVQTKAAIMPFADAQWVLGGMMNIPAHSKALMHSFDADPTTLVNLLTAGAIPGDKPMRVYSAGMHMHTLGVRGMTRVEHADGTNECLVDIPRWDFNWQMTHRFAAPKQVSPGDKLHLECQWDNPRDVDVNWGESTSDEMCLGVYYVTD